MAIQLDNRISWMDIVALGSAATSGLYLLFSVSASLTMAQADIKRIDADYKAAVEQVERNSKERQEKSLAELKDVRRETKESFDKIDAKLDKLIDRELRRNGH